MNLYLDYFDNDHYISFFSFLFFFKSKMSSAPSNFKNEQGNGKMCLRGTDPDQPVGHLSRTASAVLFCSIHVKPAFKHYENMPIQIY